MKFSERPLHVMSKPTGAICNLDCRYCYYLDREDLYPGSKFRMGAETLETLIRRTIDAAIPLQREITFAWQGGEPTLLGIPFFRQVRRLQKKWGPDGVPIHNALQTNGLLIDEEWAGFLAEEEFLTGLSVDGPQEIHDAFRLDRAGRGSFDHVMAARERLHTAGAAVNALAVVHRASAGRGSEVYQFLTANGFDHIQFIPLVELREAGRHPDYLPAAGAENGGVADGVSGRSISPDAWGRFLLDVFDDWLRSGLGSTYIQLFEETLGMWLGRPSSLCIFQKECGRAVAVEHNGDVYSCDHFVDDKHRLGNLDVVPLEQLINSDAQQCFGLAKRTQLPAYCRRCEVRFLCNGECPKNRILQTPDGEPGLNYLCAGYKQFFGVTGAVFAAMARAVRAGRSAVDYQRFGEL